MINRLGSHKNSDTLEISNSYPHSFGNRFRERQVHPNVILEGDAKEALEVMYAYFRLTLKGA